MYSYYIITGVKGVKGVNTRFAEMVTKCHKFGFF